MVKEKKRRTLFKGREGKKGRQGRQKGKNEREREVKRRIEKKSLFEYRGSRRRQKEWMDERRK